MEEARNMTQRVQTISICGRTLKDKTFLVRVSNDCRGNYQRLFATPSSRCAIKLSKVEVKSQGHGGYLKYVHFCTDINHHF